jgi:iron(III) transport system permease protein
MTQLTLTREAPSGTIRRPVWLWTLASLSVALLLVPLIYLAVRGFEVPLAEIAGLITQSRAAEFATNTVALGVSVAASALAIGVAIAVGITRVRTAWQRPLLVLSSLPLAIPSYLASYGWLVLAPSLNGFWPSLMLLTAVTVPYVILPTAARLRSLGGAQEMVARTLGRSPLQAFLETTWPLIRSTSIAGTLLVFLYTVSDFGLVAMLRFHTLTWGVNAAYSASFNRNQAAVLALLLVVLAVIAVTGERRLRGSGPGLTTRSSYTAAQPGRQGQVLLLSLASLPVTLGVVVPFIGLSTRLFTAETLSATDWPRLAAATGWTFVVALSAAIAATLVALPIAALAAKFHTRASRTIESLGYLSHALPGVVVGLSLVFLTLRVIPGIYQTLAVLVFAYVVLFASKSIGTSRAAIESIPSNVVLVARSLGETPWGAWRRVTLPLALPSIAVGALLVMVSTMKELPATLILRPTGVNTLATELWTKTVALEFGAAAPYAAILVVIAAIPAMFLGGVRSEKGEDR